MFFAPLLRVSNASIAYPCWDHSGRTVLRNLMNARISIVAEVLPMVGACTYQECKIASIKDLLLLKSLHPNSVVKHSDITPREAKL